ncbi:MAG: potassium transporter TrkG, partial [Spirochaetota bacterium]
MIQVIATDKVILFAFFIVLILIGSGLLYLPLVWNGNERLNYIDALFTSVSAVCVTGLTTVNTAQFSPIGKILILMLIQIGGLGIISFSTVYVALPRRKISFKNVGMIKEYYLDSVEYDV